MYLEISEEEMQKYTKIVKDYNTDLSCVYNLVGRGLGLLDNTYKCKKYPDLCLGKADNSGYHWDLRTNNRGQDWKNWEKK